MADQEASGQTQGAELAVAAHLIPLPQGLHCIQLEAGSPSPDLRTGLPCVHLSVPPGAAGHGVTLGGFGKDGWLVPGSAVLARVEVALGQVVMTVYQAAGQGQAPRLQVTTLATAATTAAAPAPPEPPPAPAEIAAHIQGLGDVAGSFGTWIGEPGSGRWVEGFAITPTLPGIAAGDIEYRAVLGRDWLSPWVQGGQYCGSRGIALPLLGLRVRLRGAAAANHTAQVRASFVGGGSAGPDEACEAADLAALEAFRIDILPLQSPTSTPRKRRPRRP